jgi:hypothetical protein
MAIQISTEDIVSDGSYTTTFTGDDTGQRLKGRIRFPRQGRPVVDYFYVSVSDPGAAMTTTDFIRDQDGVVVYLSGDFFRRFFHQMTSAISGSSDSFEDFICGVVDDKSLPRQTRVDFVSKQWFGPLNNSIMSF